MLHHMELSRSNRGRATPAVGRRRGAAMVEFAVVAPFFFMFVFGIIELARGLMVSQLLINASRNGCRTAIVGGQTTTSVQSSVKTELGKYGLTTTNAVVAQYANDLKSVALLTLV